MRMPMLATAAALGVLTSISAHGATGEQITQLPYPAEVSLVQEQMGWTYRQSAGNLRLYLYEPASSDKSDCNAACEKRWAPLLAPPEEKPLGDWTIVERKDGRRQWAFQQHPVYTYRRDTPERAAGERVGGAWQPMPHYRS